MEKIYIKDNKINELLKTIDAENINFTETQIANKNNK